MTYDAHELTPEGGNSALLLTFSQGDPASYWRYINQALPGITTLTIAGQTWTCETFETSSFRQGGDVGSQKLSIRLPATNPVAAQFLGQSPDMITTVSVLRIHLDDADEETRYQFLGRVIDSNASDFIVTLICEDITSSLQRPGIAPTWQRMCRHALFKAGCFVDPDTLDTVTGATAAIDRYTIEIMAAAFMDSLIGGSVTYAGVQRAIVGHSGANVRLIRPIPALWTALESGPVDVTVLPGCAHTFAACGAKSNRGNFGGFVSLSGFNPFSPQGRLR